MASGFLSRWQFARCGNGASFGCRLTLIVFLPLHLHSVYLDFEFVSHPRIIVCITLSRRKRGKPRVIFSLGGYTEIDELLSVRAETLRRVARFDGVDFII